MNIDERRERAVRLLQDLIRTQSFSKEEAQTADIIESFLQEHDIETSRHKNNVWAKHPDFDPDRPTVLLNSHHDTVKPNDGWTRDPFDPAIEDGTLYGLGSNDAGGAVVSLLATFIHFYSREKLPYNLLIAITAEEEITGDDGIMSLFPKLGKIDLAIVGEPSGMEMAVAERAAVILDLVAKGTSGHAARNVGENAIDKAVEDIRWFQTFKFPRTSELLGDIKMTVTMINAGIGHNVIPDTCRFTVDVRNTDAYTNEEVISIIKEQVTSEVRPRNTRLQASSLPVGHPLMQTAENLGIEMITSPTSSDQGLIDAPSVKIGPGQSRRSHTADEFIKLDEIREGIEGYIAILDDLRF
ncbi:MAG: M20 family metallo-hydrolase [Candidatus Marinimicrobia bacterium]|nr:M20 family metallo-hydrolase [Candidatus Neomarinimicrobiota bacterium]MCF7829488.1 M20 family metallo-hydrolase [Candidatus Neomarinimicrobiota bacterium]MCF7880114.1 M20 family metallo-hydrolase [Candidatus Neomarinimicrobiota bacterium]